MSGGQVIVGGGQAGAWVARTLRAEGYTGQITLVGAERHPPYERPPLSKGVLKGDETLPDLLDPATAATLDIRCLLGVEALAIDPGGRTVTLSDGSSLAYSILHLTTGGAPILLPIAGADDGHPVHVLRTRDDAERLRAALAPGARLAIVGGGWIGLEVAATARALDVTVTVIEARARLCARSVPAAVSAHLLALHRAHGVEVLLERKMIAGVASAGGVRLTLDDDSMIEADHVLLALGMRPNGALAAAAGLRVDDGVVVDRQGRTSDPAIFAAGDVARFPCALAGGLTRRESWANAQNQAQVAARASLGLGVHYADVPWLWSDQYGLNIQLIGHPERAVDVAVVGDPAADAGGWIAHDATGREIGAVTIGAPRELRRIRKLLETQHMDRIGA